MGTRSTYRVIEQWTDDKTGKITNENLVLVYLQYDGYPTGHPIDTAEWLSSGKVVNGYSPGEDKLVFNGAGCLAAQLVDKMKTGTGGCYIQSLKSRGKSWKIISMTLLSKKINQSNTFVMRMVNDQKNYFVVHLKTS